MERSEEPTRKKLLEARKKGQAPFSQELVNGSLLITFFSILLVFSKPLLNAFESLFSLQSSIKALIIPLLAIFLILSAVSFFAHLLQKGWLFTFKKGKKIKERPFFYNFILLTIKILLLVFLTCIFMRKSLFFLQPKEILNELLRFGLALSLSFLLLGILDYVFGIYFWKKAMKMTKEELKEEKRESDGDSQIKDHLRKKR